MPKDTSETAGPSHRRKRQTLSRGQAKNYKASLGIPSRRSINGPGIWAMVVKGKEKQAAGELYNIIETISDEMWPKPPATGLAAPEGDSDSDDSEDDQDIEKQLAKELSDINKKKPKGSSERRIASCPTDTACVVYMATKPPIDPVVVTLRHMEQVAQTGVSGTRAILRLVPASAICAATMPAIVALATELFAPVFGDSEAGSKKYKIELRIRNHQVLSKEDVIKQIAQCVPADKGHIVSLTGQDTTILVELFKGICTMAVVSDFEKYRRFNVAQIVQEKHKQTQGTDSSLRVTLPESSV
ncbi:hypothetical protein BDV93DRAFT_605888 [Ceratobasidium sp. AG-I]|nr:hypothetical protein BDV93DRAFT_605888 [Ceratobasidium sp. AG-I]